jgi:hypothetical protein
MVVYGSSSNSSQRDFILQSLLLILTLQAHTTTMSSPTTLIKRNEFTPSRPAPPPPSYKSSQRSQNGPFTPYAPHHHHGYSSTSLDSASTLYTDPSTPSTFSRHSARSPLQHPPLIPYQTKARSSNSIHLISIRHLLPFRNLLPFRKQSISSIPTYRASSIRSQTQTNFTCRYRAHHWQETSFPNVVT